jgi:nitrogen regulatory protein PII
MHAVKRIEIISDSVESEKIIEILKKSGVSSYTVVRNVGGAGVKGTISSDLDMMRMENDYVLAVCAPEQVKAVAEGLKPIFNRFGGICLISDAMEIRSVRCIASLQ